MEWGWKEESESRASDLESGKGAEGGRGMGE